MLGTVCDLRVKGVPSAIVFAFVGTREVVAVLAYYYCLRLFVDCKKLLMKGVRPQFNAQKLCKHLHHAILLRSFCNCCSQLAMTSEGRLYEQIAFFRSG